jgi:hypothetical protein
LLGGQDGDFVQGLLERWRHIIIWKKPHDFPCAKYSEPTAGPIGSNRRFDSRFWQAIVYFNMMANMLASGFQNKQTNSVT